MAITRTQIAKQLLEKGGRVGLKNGPAGGASAGGNYGGTRNPEQTYGGGDRNPGLEANINRFAAAEANRELAEEIKSKRTLKDLASDYIKNRQKLGYGLSLSIPGQTKRSSTLQKAFLKSLIDQGKIPPATLTGEKQDLAKFFVEDAFKNDDYGNFLMDEYGLPAVLMRGNVGGLDDTGGEGSSSSILLPETMTAQAPNITDKEDKEDDDKIKSFRLMSKGGRAGFKNGPAGGASAGGNYGGNRNPEQEYGGSIFSGGDGPKGPPTTGGGDGPKPVIEKFPSRIRALDKMNLERMIANMNLNNIAEEEGEDEKSLQETLASGITNMDKVMSRQDKIEAKTKELGFATGGRIGLMGGGMPYEGGIMDLESARQMYGLGKLVKKVTRGIKKIAKSPIGKAAIIGGLGYFAGGGGNPFTAAGRGKFSLGNLFSLSKNKLLSTDGKFNPFKTFGLTSILPFLTPKEEEEETLYAGADIADPTYIMNNPELFTNRRLVAEGGSMKEPVAKKTMPLLDMDGQEMDFRAEGGFVPIGRMEKADDVPARLSKNEFVFTADAVRNAGDGSVDKGAEVMYNMMKNLESGGDVSEESQGLDGARKMFQTSQRLEEVL
jgi:hypothetical protein